LGQQFVKGQQLVILLGFDWEEIDKESVLACDLVTVLGSDWDISMGSQYGFP
jgi:hypothetical protein